MIGLNYLIIGKKKPRKKIKCPQCKKKFKVGEYRAVSIGRRGIYVQCPHCGAVFVS